MKLFRLKKDEPFRDEPYLWPIFLLEDGKITLKYPYNDAEAWAELHSAISNLEKLPAKILEKHPRLEFLDTMKGPYVVSWCSGGGSNWETADPNLCWTVPNLEVGMLLYWSIRDTFDTPHCEEEIVNIELAPLVTDIDSVVAEVKGMLPEYDEEDED